MTKEEIIASCNKGLSEDIDGEFYTIYDADLLYRKAYTQGFNDACNLNKR